jgi:hypothetical protein
MIKETIETWLNRQKELIEDPEIPNSGHNCYALRD